MTDFDVPEYARAALRRVTDRVDELSTQTIRFRTVAQDLAAKFADRPRPDPAEILRAAAEKRDAPIELVRVARAVRDGRTSWQEIVDGKASSVPEFVAYQTHMNQQVTALIESGELKVTLPEEPSAPPVPAEPAPRRVARQEEDEDEVAIEWVRR